MRASPRQMAMGTLPPALGQLVFGQPGGVACPSRTGCLSSCGICPHVGVALIKPANSASYVLRWPLSLFRSHPRSTTSHSTRVPRTIVPHRLAKLVP